MPVVPADISTIWDVSINGVGYMFDKRREDQALLGHTPTFVPRNNTSGIYGDNEQDFFLTGSQKDWSGGAEQKHWSTDEASVNRFFASTGVEISVPGEIRLTPVSRNPALPAIYAGCGRAINPQHFVAGNTNAYYVTSLGVTDLGAHGAGTPYTYGACTDGNYHYVSGLTKIRKVTSAGVWSDFTAAGGYGSICYLNNQLYACNGTNLWSFSTTGVPTLIFPWTDATGTAFPSHIVKLISYGGDLLIFKSRGSGNRPELWIFDGTNTQRLAQLPIGSGGDIVESNGIVFLSTAELAAPDSLGVSTPGGVIYAWVNGSIQEMWRDDASGAGSNPPFPDGIPALGLYAGSVVFACRNGQGRFLRRYILETGAVEQIQTYTGTPPIQILLISSTLDSILLVGDNVPAVQWPGPGDGLFGTGNLDSSLYDFGSSLLKVFRAIRVDFDAPAGCSVTASYQLNTLTGSYTAIAGTLVSGVDLPLPANLTGNSISIRVTLNGDGLRTPVVRRVYVRAAPFQQAFRKAVYHLDCSSLTGKTPVMHRDGRPEGRSGKEMAQALYSLVVSQAIVTINDSLGTYQGVLDPEGFQLTQFNPDEYVATVSVREV